MLMHDIQEKLALCCKELSTLSCNHPCRLIFDEGAKTQLGPAIKKILCFVINEFIMTICM